MLRIENLTYRIGTRLLLDGANAAIAPGQRVGLVGRNGSGKTTLLRLIAGELEPGGGRIEVSPRWRLGLTRQEAPGGDEGLINTVLAADAELMDLRRAAERMDDPHRLAEVHERLRHKRSASAEARAARILAGLGFTSDHQRRPCRDFSGGWRMRVALAALLFLEPDLLLLDEPTNHLDLEATLWLEDHLRRYPGTLVLVSHERGLLTRAVDAILHLDGARLTLYPGPYDRFEEVSRQRAVMTEKQRAKEEATRAHLQAFVDRFRAKASKARQAQSRLKMMARLPSIAVAREEDVVALTFPPPDPLPSPLVSLEDVAVGYGGPPVLRGVSLRLDADDRIGLLGPNGNGKSTLIKLLAGRLMPVAGEMRRSGKLKVGYFAQHQADELDGIATPLLALARRRPLDPELRLRQHLGHFGFSQARAETPINALSGGEKARLLLALMASTAPHLLLLDEPTNHLDIPTRAALVDALNAFDGAVVLVSHDPHLLSLTVDRLWLVDGGRVTPFDGDLDDYRARILGRGDRTDGPATTSPASSGPVSRPSSTPPGGTRKALRRETAARQDALQPLKRQLAAAEGAVARLAADRADLLAALADPSLYREKAADIGEMQQRLAQVERALAAAEDAWVTLHEELDHATAAAGA